MAPSLSSAVIESVFGFVASTSPLRLCLLGLAVRVCMVLYSYIHDATFAVHYTDIDYDVVTDGAAAMWRTFPSGRSSPFDRVTYRYTPLLALVMLPNVILFKAWGKLLLSCCDVGAAWYAFDCFHTGSAGASNADAPMSWRHPKMLVCLFILFNPIVINVSTRGNSDMITAFLVLACLSHFTRRQYSTSGLFLGLAIHVKIYPVIYIAALTFALLHRVGHARGIAKYTSFGHALIAAATSEVFLTTLLRAATSVAVGAAIPTLLCTAWYGKQYLDEAVFYHIGRLDHRHNLSPYWYPLYLGMAVRDVPDTLGSTAPTDAWLRSGVIAFLPQLAALVVAAWALRSNIMHAVAVSTVIFVAFNKVCTVQYFVWYLPLLPFIFVASYEPTQPSHAAAGGAKRAIANRSATLFVKVVLLPLAWFGSLVLWMLLSVKVEFGNQPAFLELWLVSVLFCLMQVTVAAVIARAAVEQQRKVDAVN